MRAPHALNTVSRSKATRFERSLWQCLQVCCSARLVFLTAITLAHQESFKLVICPANIPICPSIPSSRGARAPLIAATIAFASRPCVDFPQKTQRQEIQSQVKAAVAHMGSSEKGNPALQESITGDQGPAHSGGGEGYPDQWCRDGRRWRLGARPCLVQKIENRGESDHDLQTCKSLRLS